MANMHDEFYQALEDDYFLFDRATYCIGEDVFSMMVEAAEKCDERFTDKIFPLLMQEIDKLHNIWLAEGSDEDVAGFLKRKIVRNF